MNFPYDKNGMSVAFGVEPMQPTAEDLAEFAEEMEYDSDTDEVELLHLYMDDQDELALDSKVWAERVVPSAVNEVVNRLWQFGYLGGSSEGYGVKFPYKLTFENGQSGGWRMRLLSVYKSDEDTAWQAYCEMLGRSLDPEVRYISAYGAPDISFEDFCRHLDKVCDAVEWVYESVCRRMRFDVVRGGSTDTRPPEPEDFAQYKWAEKWEQMFPQYKFIPYE